jgi:hypothetical protein
MLQRQGFSYYSLGNGYHMVKQKIESHKLMCEITLTNEVTVFIFVFVCSYSGSIKYSLYKIHKMSAKLEVTCKHTKKSYVTLNTDLIMKLNCQLKYFSTWRIFNKVQGK